MDTKTIAVGDYLLVNHREHEEEKPKQVVVRVKELGTRILTRLETEPHISSRTISIKMGGENILMNFGPDPYPGKAYGFDFKERFRKTLETDFAPLHFFVNMPKDERARFIEAFNRVGRRLTKQGLGMLYESSNVVYEVRGKRGKYAGMFIPAPKNTEKPHRIQFFVETVTESFDYLVLHELGHLLQKDYLDPYPRLISSWQVAYDRTVYPAEVDKAKSASLLKAWLAMQNGNEVMSIKSLAKEIEEEDRASLRAVLHWIAQNRGVRAHELDVLMLAENHDEITSLWPTKSIAAKRELKPAVSEYATKAMPELIAESFAFYMLKKKLPKSITALIEKSLATAKKGPAS